MLQAVSYFFAVLLLALALMLWDWRHAIAWQIKPVLGDQDTVAKKKNVIVIFFQRLWNHLLGIIKTVLVLLKQVLLVKMSHDEVSKTQVLGNYTRVLPCILLSLSLLSFLWLPTLPDFPVFQSVYSGLGFVVWVTVLCVLNTLISTNEKQFPATIWLVLSASLVLLFAVIGAGLPSNNTNLQDIMLQNTPLVAWQQVLGFLGFVLATLVLLHRHHSLKLGHIDSLNAYQDYLSMQPIAEAALQKQESKKDVDAEAHDNQSDADISETDSDQHIKNTKNVLNNKNNAVDSQLHNTQTAVHDLSVWQPIYPLFHSANIIILLVDYVLLVALSACMVVMYLGGSLTLFGLDSLLPETWFVIKLFGLVLLFLLLRKLTAPFFAMQGDISSDSLLDRVVIDYQRTARWIWCIAMPLVLVNLIIQWITTMGAM